MPRAVRLLQPGENPLGIWAEGQHGFAPREAQRKECRCSTQGPGLAVGCAHAAVQRHGFLSSWAVMEHSWPGTSVSSSEPGWTATPPRDMACRGGRPCASMQLLAPRNSSCRSCTSSSALKQQCPARMGPRLTGTSVFEQNISASQLHFLSLCKNYPSCRSFRWDQLSSQHVNLSWRL